MITEYDNIVSIEIAEELRNLGFDMLTHVAYFKDDGELYSFPNQMEKGSFGNNHILAPTQDVVAQWFRDVHNIDIEVHADVGMLGIKVYSPYVSTYEPKPLTEDEKEEIKALGAEFSPLGSIRFRIEEDENDGFEYGYQWLDILDFLNSHHFDYRGLIEKGLALEAPKGMYDRN